MGKQRFKQKDTVRRSAGVLVGVLGDRVVACDVVRHQAHVVGGLLGWLMLLEEATALADLVADVAATTGSTERDAREEVTEAVRLGRSLQLIGRESGGVTQISKQRDAKLLLRAGAVRTPSGEIWLLPCADDIGVATIVGELVRAGCDDLGREVVGVNGDSIVVEGPSSFQVEHGPIDGILVPEYQPDHEASAAPLDPFGAVKELVGSALDLSYAGNPGVQMLCDVAASARALRIRHHDPVALARVLAATEKWCDLGELDLELRRHRRHRRQHNGLTQPAVRYLNELEVHISGDIAFKDTTIEGDQVTIAIDRSGYRSWALAGLSRQIWHALASDDTPALPALARNEADRRGGSDERSARVVSRALTSMMDQGLLERVPGGTEPQGVDLSVVGDPNEDRQELWRCGPSGRRVLPVGVAEAWPSLTATGYAIDWLGHRLVTDVDSLRPVLIGLRGAAVASRQAPLTSEAALVEIKSGAGRADEMLIRLNGTRLWCLTEDAVVRVLGVILANLAAEDEGFGQSLGEISIATCSDRCVVKVGGAPSAEPSNDDQGVLRHHATLFGARIDDHRILIPELTRAAKWLASGATGEMADLWTPYELAGVVVSGARDVLGGWVRALTELAPAEGTSDRYLSETLGHGDVPLVVADDDKSVSGIAERILAGTGDPREVGDPEPDVRVSQIVAERNPAVTDLGRASWQWATQLGRASWVEESAKVTTGRLSVGRGLLKIRLSEGAGGRSDGSTSLATDAVRDAVAAFGLDVETCEEVARTSVAARNLYLGAEHAGSNTRRKLYVRGLPASAWEQIAPRWSDRLRHDDAPDWVAWKWTDGEPGWIERSVYLAQLGGAQTIGEQVDPLFDAMGPEWVDVVVHLMGRLGIGRTQTADDGDLLTLDESGRRSVDISRRLPVRRSDGVESEARWLAHIAALSDADSTALLDWSYGRHASRLIFGVDGRGAPFVNLYGSRFTGR